MVPGDGQRKRDGHVGSWVNKVLTQLLLAWVTDLPDRRRRTKHLHQVDIVSVVCIQIGQSPLRTYADRQADREIEISDVIL